MPKTPPPRARSTPGAGRESRRKETRRKLFDAALAAFRSDGVGACRIDDIAHAAGVSRAAFYFHFPSKEDVLIELLRRTEERIAGEIEALPAGTPLCEVLSATCDALAATWEPDARLLPEVAMATLHATAAEMVYDRESGRVRAALAGRFRAAAARGELKALLPVEILSDFFLANALGGMLGYCVHPLVPLRDVLRVVETLFLHGAGQLEPARVDGASAPTPRTPR